MLKMKIKGLRELQRSLHRLRDQAKSLNGTHNVPIHELLTDAFILTHTHHRSVDEWFAASPFKIESHEDFKAIPDGEWDAYVRASTTFGSWQEMLGKAAAAYFRKKLFA